MLKEIHEQPDAVAETITDRLPNLDGVDLSDVDARRRLPAGASSRIVIVACGTSYHAGLIGRYAIEHWARVPVEMDIASEYRYRDPVHRPERPGHRHHPVGGDRRHPGGDAAGAGGRLEGARDHQRDGQPGDPRRGRRPLHPLGDRDQRGRDQDLRQPGRRDVPARASPGGAARDAASRSASRSWSPSSRRFPQAPGDDRLAATSTSRRSPARSTTSASSCTSAATSGSPVCLEGALKLKEISYIPADAYAAGEMKHGPIALLDESTPVVAVATDSPVVEKILSNMEEVRARGADVIAVATEGSEARRGRRRPDALRPAHRLDRCSRSSRSCRSSCSPTTSPARTA